jgi:hypothetical protein
LEKQKFAVTERPKKAENPDVTVSPIAQEITATAVEPPRRMVPPTDSKIAAPPAHSRQRGRHIPAIVRRAVFERDAARCTYVDDRGERCRETHGLELHHRLPFGKHGPHTAANLTLHCPVHNALAAELDFGREHMAQKRDSSRHESLAFERRAAEEEGLRRAPE